MTSKLDYLKKYDANGADNEKEGKKKKKKQHTATQPRVLGMMMVDAEVDVLPTVAAVSAPGTTNMQSSLWDVGGEDDDDGPVVIETAETRKVAKGAWTAVDDVPNMPVPSSSTSSSIQLPRRTRHDSSDDDEDVPRRRPVIASTDNTSQARTKVKKRRTRFSLLFFEFIFFAFVVVVVVVVVDGWLVCSLSLLLASSDRPHSWHVFDPPYLISI